MADQQRIAELERNAREVFGEVEAELRQYPGVVEVGIGLKRRGGQLTDEIAFRVYVDEKVAESELSPEHVVPKQIRGFPTDVITRYERLKLTGFDDEDDWKNYPTKLGGIRVGSEDAAGTGTLGCFARRTSDSKVVLLSNHHVLLSGSAEVGSEVGQPKFTRSCCCTCNVIAVVAAGDETLDCAIATLNDGVPFVSKIRKIRRADDTVEQSGVISGTAAAVSTSEVWKVGARTGLTRGVVEQTSPDVVIDPLDDFPRMAYFGDSGSVAIDLSGNVIGLVKEIDKDAATDVKAIATPIADVLAHHDITILTTDESEEHDVAEDLDELDLTSLLPTGSPFAPMATRLQAGDSGRELVRLFAAHRDECLDLVNARGAVTVAWHRAKGPAWLAATLRSAKEPAYPLPRALDGVSREQAARRVLAALEAHGSDALRADVATHKDRLIEAFTAGDRLDDVLAAWEHDDRSAQPVSPHG